MQSKQFATPMIVREGEATRLHQVPLDKKSYSEAWLQEKLFQHPALLPLAEIEPVFDGLISVARELKTPAGPLDLLFVNSEGFLSLVETKLWRNPQARREVVAQIVDYAKELAKWGYSDLVDAVSKANGHPQDSDEDVLLALVQESSEDDFDESKFIDSVQDNLAKGRFLLLIVGDGIHHGVEEMVDLFRHTPQLGFTFGLVEIGLYQESPDQQDPLYIQPRILARTQEIRRAVIEIKGPIARSDVSIEVPPDERSTAAGKKSISQDAFLEDVKRDVSPEAAEFAARVLTEAPKHEIDIEWGKIGPQFWYNDDGTGKRFTFGFFRYDGVFEIKKLFLGIKKAGLPLEIARDHLDAVAALIPGAKRKHTQSGQEVLSGPHGEPAKFESLIPVKEKWLTAIDKTIDRIREALET